MIHKYKAPRILFPRTANEALNMAASESEAVFWAGGTRLSSPYSRDSLIDLPRVVIALTMVEELARASRSEQGLEIGAMMTLDRLALLGRSSLPPGLSEAISSVGNRPLRCRATLGGHLIGGERIGDLRPLLQILDTKVEIRYQRERRGRRKPTVVSQKIPVAGLDKPGEVLHRGTLVTKISIPTKSWNFGQYLKIRPDGDDRRSLIFCAIARIDKNVLAEFRMALSDTYTGVLRDPELETSLEGRPLPLKSREREGLRAAIDLLTKDWAPHSFEKESAVSLAESFFDRASI